MSDWAANAGDRYPIDFASNLTPNASPHTKGAWSSASTYLQANGVYVKLEWCQSNSVRTVLLDIGIGASWSQVVLIPNMVWTPAVGGADTGRDHQENVFFPIAIPAGAVWVRAQSSLSSHPDLWCYHRPVIGGAPFIGSVCSAYGVNAGTSLGTEVVAGAGDGEVGAWTQITASCDRIRAIIISANTGLTPVYSSTDIWSSFDVGIGPSGAEVKIISDITNGVGGNIGITHPQYFGPYAVDIPSGTRISIRTYLQGTSYRSRYFAIYGIS